MYSINKKISYLLLNNIDNFSCPFCTEFIYDTDKVSETYQCREGHWGCKNCWIQTLRMRKECPTCRCKVESLSDLSRSRFIETGASKVQIRCLNSLQIKAINSDDENYSPELCGAELLFDENGCKEIISVEQLNSHLGECIHAIKKCPNDINGCTDVFRLKDLEQHQQNCGFHLENCPNCDSQIIRKLLDHHVEEECLNTLITCYECSSDDIQRGEMEYHLNTNCPDKIVDCIFKDNGCNLKFKRSDLSTHLQSIEHSSNLNQKVEELKDKLALQHIEISEFHEKETHLSNQLKENEKQMNQMKEEQMAQKEIINYLISRQEKFESVWEVTNFSKKEFQKNIYITSPVISVGHHEFQLWLYPNGETAPSNNLALYLVLIKGERALVSFSVFIKNNHNVTHNLNSKFEKDKFLEVNGKGWGWGFEKNFKTDGYLQNDTLSIEFTIDIKKQALTTDLLDI
ncbi:hypothetical protein ACTA71_003750 [Dictyostelium dimigraforme]